MRHLLYRFLIRSNVVDTRREAVWRGVRRSVDPLYGHGVLVRYAEGRMLANRDEGTDMADDWRRVGADLQAAIAHESR